MIIFVLSAFISAFIFFAYDICSGSFDMATLLDQICQSGTSQLCLVPSLDVSIPFPFDAVNLITIVSDFTDNCPSRLPRNFITRSCT